MLLTVVLSAVSILFALAACFICCCTCSRFGISSSPPSARAPTAATADGVAEAESASDAHETRIDIDVDDTAAAETADGGAREIRNDVESFEELLRVVRGCSDHHYAKKTPPETTVSNRQWAKSIQKEWAMLKDGLPPSISVVAYEDRIDLMRAVIVGAQGTPYRDGLFFFDISFPSAYPRVPPSVHFHSRGLRLNPNLYTNGTVCLSILNTWKGSINEKWIPNKSTVLQVLVSIQGLVLNEKPIFNEPGLGFGLTWLFRSLPQIYSEHVLLASLKLAVYTMRRRPEHFEELVGRHFRGRARAILEACRQSQQQMTGSGMKAEMESLLPVLMGEFRKIGADCGQPSSVGQHRSRQAC